MISNRRPRKLTQEREKRTATVTDTLEIFPLPGMVGEPLKSYYTLSWLLTSFSTNTCWVLYAWHGVHWPLVTTPWGRKQESWHVCSRRLGMPSEFSQVRTCGAMMQIWVLLTVKLGAGSHWLASEDLSEHPQGQTSLRGWGNTGEQWSLRSHKAEGGKQHEIKRTWR